MNFKGAVLPQRTRVHFTDQRPLLQRPMTMIDPYPDPHYGHD